MAFALILGFVNDSFTGRDETTLFHDATAGRIILKVAAYEGFDVHGAERQEGTDVPSGKSSSTFENMT